MAKSKSMLSRFTREVANTTGRTDAEIKLILSAAVAAAGIALVIRTLQVLFDVEPPPPWSEERAPLKPRPAQGDPTISAP